VDDLGSDLSHTFFGGEVAFPRVLSGLAFGLPEGSGPARGRKRLGSDQLAGERGHPARRPALRVPDRREQNELGATFSGTAGLARSLALRFSLLFRPGLESGRATTPFGTASHGFLVGSH